MNLSKSRIGEKIRYSRFPQHLEKPKEINDSEVAPQLFMESRPVGVSEPLENLRKYNESEKIKNRRENQRFLIFSKRWKT